MDQKLVKKKNKSENKSGQPPLHVSAGISNISPLNKNQMILGDLKPSTLPSLKKEKIDFNKLIDSSSNEYL